ncbi:MAG: hypothetical protein WCK77_13310 [Verrucomicrobiota bacterium]
MTIFHTYLLNRSRVTRPLPRALMLTRDASAGFVPLQPRTVETCFDLFYRVCDRKSNQACLKIAATSGKSPDGELVEQFRTPGPEVSLRGGVTEIVGAVLKLAGFRAGRGLETTSPPYKNKYGGEVTTKQARRRAPCAALGAVGNPVEPKKSKSSTRTKRNTAR